MFITLPSLLEFIGISGAILKFINLYHAPHCLSIYRARVIIAPNFSGEE